MQGGEYQVSRFGSSHSNGNGLKIPHLTKQDDVRTLAQGSAQSSKVALGIGADFTLAYDTFLVTVEKFQWILQSDDMLLLCTIDFVNDTGEGSGLSTSCRTCHKDQSLFLICQTDDGIRNTKSRWIRKLKSNDPDHSGERTALTVCAHTIPGESLYREGKIIVSGY